MELKKFTEYFGGNIDSLPIQCEFWIHIEKKISHYTNLSSVYNTTALRGESFYKPIFIGFKINDVCHAKKNIKSI